MTSDIIMYVVFEVLVHVDVSMLNVFESDLCLFQ